MAKLNENLKFYINNRGLKLTSYAKILKMKTSTVGNYLSGERMPDATALMRIFDADPNLSANFIMFGVGPVYLSQCGLSRVVDTANIEDAVDPEFKVDTDEPVQEHIADDPTLVAALQARIKSQQETIDNLLDKLGQRDDLIKELIGKVCKN